jgi:hypothetical protein
MSKDDPVPMARLAALTGLALLVGTTTAAPQAEAQTSAVVALPMIGSGPTLPDLINPERRMARVAPAARRLQCVPYARERSGIQIFGDAYTWWRQAAGSYIRSGTPAVGSVLVTRGYNNATRGHVAVVRTILSEREILIDHANWMNRGEITEAVPVLDVSANNDWSEVRVWHIPGGHWGGRVYSAQGFIHPVPLAPAAAPVTTGQ